MKSIELLTDKCELKDSDGNVIVEIDILSLYYELAQYIEEFQSTDNKDKFINAAEKINAQYGCNLSWGQVLDLFNQLDDIVVESKKNSTSTQK